MSKDAQNPAPLLSANALTVLERRYLRRNEEGEVLETPSAMFTLSLIHISEPTRPVGISRMPSSA